MSWELVTPILCKHERIQERQGSVGVQEVYIWEAGVVNEELDRNMQDKLWYRKYNK